ncbi:hypothetical protein NEMBOFW57_005537 [Staphylotrichum longicolle]|uniref:Uncharacterized protein n=1 Tax=Staphylotrichum longicolle TaxID=669026 RepID=A0AAD4HW51_9PEZI|nr:hypothetical protein NEMBOFW57_005537 [Staphylotrichum longicolle]
MTDKWGMFRNIPESEIRKMARVRRRRLKNLGRRTKFLRRHGAGEFQEVPSSKLDAYEKRAGNRLDSPTSQSSQSSGLPPHVIYRTPSDHASSPDAAGSPHVSVPGSSTEDLAVDVNSQAESVLGDDPSVQAGSPQPSLQTTRDRSRHDSTLQKRALEDALAGNYHAAARAYKLTAVPSKPWQRAVRQFRIDVMDAAWYPGCPQSLTARVTGILSVSLVRERETYERAVAGNDAIGNESELCKILIALKLEATFWSSILVQQRALQVWEPILGRHHPKVKLIRDYLEKHRKPKTVAADFGRRLHRLDESDAVIGSEVEIDRPEMRRVNNLVHLGDGPPDQLLEQARTLSSVSANGQQIRQDIAWVKLGRSRALLGVYYSFLRRFDDAERAFQTSEEHMERETHAEIKLHRTLWYIEHKTRVGDWTGARALLGRAHEVFMSNQTPSDFMVHHFPARFANLCSAVAEQQSVDEAARQFSEMGPTGHTDAERRDHELPAAEGSGLSLSRLFPSTPGGANSEINIDAWRQFVQYPPPA